MIRLENVSFQYADTTQGVQDINLTISQGECVVLTGRSGNGKTTLTRLINGLAPKYYPGEFSGSIRIAGLEVNAKPLWVWGKTVGSVFQDPKRQFFSSELAGEVAFACENYGLPQNEIVTRTDAAITAFGLNGLRACPIDRFSSGEMQRTAIASVYALGPKIYVCDEPTANLDAEGALRLAQVLLQLKAEGNTLLIAEHRLSWLRRIADHVVYLEDGHIVWQRTAAEVAAIAAKERISFGLRSFVEVVRPPLPTPTGEGEPQISAIGLTSRRQKKTIWEGLDFQAWSGQVVGITGGNGAGKTTLAKILSGLYRESAGKVMLNGTAQPPAKRRNRVWYSDNDTGAQFFTNSVSEELLLGSRRHEETLELARNLLRRLNLYAYKDAHPAILSGGQRLRLSIACGLISGRDILIFDEPTSGLDGGNLSLVGNMFKEAAAQGKCVLVITHDHELMAECCTHLFTLSK